MDLVHGPLYGPVHGLPQWNALIVEDEFYQRSKRILGNLKWMKLCQFILSGLKGPHNWNFGEN